MELTKIEIDDGWRPFATVGGETVDLDATLEGFVSEVLWALSAEHPRAIIDYRWEDSESGPRIDIDGAYEPEEYDAIRADIQRVLEEIDLRGSFWIGR